MASSEFARRVYPKKLIPQQQFNSQDLKETERLLKNMEWFQPNSTSNVKAWMEQRQKSIEAIGNLKESLENLHWACNAAHGLGAAMEVVGGLALIAGNIFSKCGHESVGEFLAKKVSPVTTATGIATTMSSSVAETGLTHLTLKEVKMVLKKDEECTKVLLKNFEHSKQIDSYLRSIFNYSILSENFQQVVQLVQEGISLVEAGYEEFSKLIDKLQWNCTEISERTETVIENIYTTMKKILNDPEIRKSIRNICDIIQRSPLAIESIKLGLRISVQLCDILKVDIFTSLLGFGVLKTTAGEMATKCFLGTIIIATNVLSVISAVRDAQEGTLKYSKIIKELNLALAMELNTVRKNYQNIL